MVKATDLALFSSKHSVLDSPRRAAVAMIFRAANVAPVNSSRYKNFDKFLNQEWAPRKHLELLFILRSHRTGDRWSGHVAFPGGRQDKCETDYQSVVREVCPLFLL